MNTKTAAAIRKGIRAAQQVIRRERVAPRNMTPWFDGRQMPLWERAYHHEFSRAARDGRIQPPSAPSGYQRNHKVEVSGG